jgi:hypothetical protein
MQTFGWDDALFAVVVVVESFEKVASQLARLVTIKPENILEQNQSQRIIDEL